MALNPNQGGDSNKWNYSKPEEPGYSLTLKGTVKAIQEVQAMNFGSDGRPSTPAFWENNGQPKMNIRLVLAGPSGGFRTFTFTPAGKAAKEGKKRSIHLDLFAIAGGVNMMNLLEKTIEITTVAPPQGFGYGKGNPRPWEVRLVPDEGPHQLSQPLDPQYMVPQLLANQGVSGGQFTAPAQATPMAPATTTVVSSAEQPEMSGMPQPQPVQQEQHRVPPPPERPAPSTFDDDIPF